MSSVSGYTFHQFPFFMGYWRLAIGRHAMLPCCPSCPLAESSDVMASYTWRTQRPVNVMKKTRQRCFHWMVWWWLYMTLWWFKQLKWRYPWGYWRDTPSGIKHGEIHNLRWENHRKSSLLLGFIQHVLAARGLFFGPMRPMASPLKVVTRCHCQPQLQKKHGWMKLDALVVCCAWAQKSWLLQEAVENGRRCAFCEVIQLGPPLSFAHLVPSIVENVERCWKMLKVNENENLFWGKGVRPCSTHKVDALLIMKQKNIHYQPEQLPFTSWLHLVLSYFL